MINSCSVNSFRMPSYMLMLYLVLSLVANVQTLSLKLVGSKKQNRVYVVVGYVWLSRVAMILSYMMLDIWSICFQKYKK